MKNILDRPKSATDTEYYPYRSTASLLARRHPKLKELVKTIGSLNYEVPIWRSIHDAVLYAIVGQMLSVPAANTIIKKLKCKHGNAKNIIQWAHKTRRKRSQTDLISLRKKEALARWHEFACQNESDWRDWKHKDLNECRKRIVSLWGFGQWSADMIAIFHLGKMDVWPKSDLGLIKMSKIIFGAKNYDKAEHYLRGCETVAALYIWEALNRRVSFTTFKNG